VNRIGHVHEPVTAFHSLYQAAYRVFRAHRENAGALRFMHDLEPELLALQRELEAGTFRPGAYHTFTIWEPKERQNVAAHFRDRA
jgi:hypothetical protein